MGYPVSLDCAVQFVTEKDWRAALVAPFAKTVCPVLPLDFGDPIVSHDISIRLIPAKVKYLPLTSPVFRVSIT